MERINVLQILPGSNTYNGISDCLLQNYKIMDKSKVHFDFLFCRGNSMKARETEPFLSESKFIALSSNISGKLLDSARLVGKIREIVQESNYDIIHINTGSIYITAACVLAAVMGRAPHIISHSHNSSREGVKKSNWAIKRIKGVFNGIMRRYIVQRSDLLFACSEKAGEYLFGNDIRNNAKYHTVPNAIYIDKYLYNLQVREEVRSQNKIEEKTTVLGCVASFSTQKNHSFLLKVFSEYIKMDPDALLLLVGDGIKKNEVIEEIEALGLSEKVKLLGQRNDVNRLLQAMDVFVLTSFFEGLSIATVEAQASGLPVFLSDTISAETNISGLVHFISLKSSAADWAKSIFEEKANHHERKNMKETMQNAGYDIFCAAEKLENAYIELVKDK